MSRLWSQGSGVIRLNSHTTMIKAHVVNVKFTSHLQDMFMQIERESRDNTRCQIEDSDSPYRDSCHDFKKCDGDRSSSWEKMSYGVFTTWNWRPDGVRGAFRRYAWTWRMLRTIDPECKQRHIEQDSLFWSCEVPVLCDFTSHIEIVDLLYQVKVAQHYPH